MASAPLDEHRLTIPAALVRDGRRRQLLLVLLPALLVLAIGLVIFARSSDKPQAAQFRVEPATRRTIVSAVEAAGRVDVSSRVEVPAPQAGQLEALYVTPGSSVARGQLLATLDTALADLGVRGSAAAVRAAEGRVSEARAALAQARDTRERLERLEARGLAAQSEVLSARAAEEKAKAALSATSAERSMASGQLAAAKHAQRVHRLEAPMDGVVLKAPLWTGSVVQPEQGALFVIGAPLSHVRVDAEVAEADIGHVRPGLQVTFTVPAYPEREFPASIEKILVDAKREAGPVLYPVVLSAANPDGVLLPGMSARVKIQVATARNVLAVRDAALRFTPEGESASPSRVWLSSDGVELSPVEITPGVSDGMYTQVLRSRPELRAGAPVVIGRAVVNGTTGSGPGISLKSKQ